MILTPTRSITEDHGFSFLVTNYCLHTENHGMSRKKKFDNSIIRDQGTSLGTKEKSRDRKDYSVILRDTPCEEKENRDSP